MWVEGMAQMVECLPIKCMALSSSYVLFVSPYFFFSVLGIKSRTFP
jgi:hypothetical protein